MPESFSAKRMLRLMPSLYRITSLPSIDYTFFGLFSGATFRPYLWDEFNRFFKTEDGRTIALLREDDMLVDAVYGMALEMHPDVGEVCDLGVDVDADLGESFSLTFVLHDHWDMQPNDPSAIYPFYNQSGTNPRLGYDETSGLIEAAGWTGVTSNTPQSLTYNIGWVGHLLVPVTMVVDATVNKTYLYVQGELRATLNEAVRANAVDTMRIQRTDSDMAVTMHSRLEAYFMHDSALAAEDVVTLHKMFSTGLTDDSRVVRTFAALAMCLAEIEDIGWRFAEYRSIADSTGGALTLLARDFGVERIAGETDDELRTRVENRLLELFSQTTPHDILDVAVGSTGLNVEDILLRLNKGSANEDKHAYFSVQLPPGQDAQLDALEEALGAAKAAGVKHQVGVLGTFAWDVAGAGFGYGSWNFVR